MILCFLSQGIDTLVVDLAQVDIIDAAGLGVMLELRAELQSQRIDFKLMNVTSTVSKLLEFTCLDSVFEIITEEEISFLLSQSVGELAIST